MTAPAPRGGAIFWAGVLAFVVADLAAVLGPYVAGAVPVHRAAPFLAYVLLAGFALSLAVVIGVVASAVRARRAPPLVDGVRAGVALALVAGHAALLVLSRSRGA